MQSSTRENHHIPPMPWMSWRPREIIVATLVVSAVIAGFLLAYRLRYVVFSVLLAVMLQIAIRPLVEWCRRWGVKRQITVITIYLVTFVVAAGSLALLVPALIEQFQSVAAELPIYYQTLRRSLTASPIALLTLVGQYLPTKPSFDWVSVLVTQAGSSAQQEYLLDGMVQGAFLFVAVFAIAFYWTLDRERLLAVLRLALPITYRDPMTEIIAEMEAKIGAFYRGQLILCAMVGGLSYVAYSLIGLPYVLALAAIAFVFEVVPVVGPILGAVPAVLIGLTIGPGTAALVISFNVGVQVLENHLLVPKVMDRTVGVDPIITILAIVVFGKLFGLVGALAAVPIAAILQDLCMRFVFTTRPPPTSTESADTQARAPVFRTPLSALRLATWDFAEDIRKRQRAADTEMTERMLPLEERIEALVLDIGKRLAQRESGAGGSLLADDHNGERNGMARIRQIAVIAAVAIATLVAALLLWELRGAIIIALLAIALSAAVRASVLSLWRSGLPSRAAQVIVTGLVLALFFGVSLVTIYVLVERLPLALEDLVTYYVQWRESYAQGGGAAAAFALRLPAPADLGRLLGGDDRTALLRLALGFTSNLGSLMVDATLVASIAMYWTADRARYERLWLSLLPPRPRSPIRKMIQATDNVVGTYIRSEVVQYVLAFSLLALGYSLGGIKYAYLLAWLGALLQLLPLIGVFLASLLTVVIGATYGIGMMLVAIVYALAVFAAIKYAGAGPADQRTGPAGILSLLLAVALIDLWGVVGLLIAQPIAYALRTVYEHLKSMRENFKIVSGAEPIADYAEHLANIAREINTLNEAEHLQVASLHERAVRLVKDLEEIEKESQRPEFPICEAT